MLHSHIITSTNKCSLSLSLATLVAYYKILLPPRMKNRSLERRQVTLKIISAGLFLIEKRDRFISTL